MSLHGRNGSSSHGSPAHGAALFNSKILIDATDDGDLGDEDYEDVKCELQANGHHLTSVLANPRETFLENLFDEFAIDQATPLDPPSTPYSPMSLFASSHHTTHPSSSHPAVNPLLLTLTQTELQQIERLARRLQSVHDVYADAHPQNSHAAAHAAPRTPRSYPSLHDLTSASPTTPRKRGLGEALRLCYREVPEIFFR
eukprot:gene35355-42847_t